MISLTKMNGSPFVLNSDWIRSIEATPDTVVTLLNGERLMVRESVEDLVRKTLQFKSRVLELSRERIDQELKALPSDRAFSKEN